MKTAIYRWVKYANEYKLKYIIGSYLNTDK